MEALKRYLNKTGIELSEPVLTSLQIHAHMVLEANSLLNLTRIVEWDEVVRLHLLDSLLALPMVQSGPPGPLLDMGSGAGYPGIPLALASERPCLLVESVKKKAAFLDRVVAELDLHDVRVAGIRVEEAATEIQNRSAYAVVVARAVSQLGSLVELASPLLMPGGILVALKGRLDVEELHVGQLVAARVGLLESQVKRYVLPGGSEQRSLVCYEKSGSSRIKLPRRNGLAQKNPLL